MMQISLIFRKIFRNLKGICVMCVPNSLGSRSICVDRLAGEISVVFQIRI